ncbi:hypothetical protein NMY22_g19491 [Coprinellus aureogranulatus]|nr:hypothetical protein NMY22_g19491 [Coprinellus aureogranulatus]
MERPSSPPPAYAFLEGALPPIYTPRATDPLNPSPRRRTSSHPSPIHRNAEEEGEKTAGIDDMPTEITFDPIPSYWAGQTFPYNRSTLDPIDRKKKERMAKNVVWVGRNDCMVNYDANT